MKSMAANHDTLIIGGGHNGLVTAFYLAQAGLKPLVLERRRVVGGAAATEEFHPGFRCSTLAHSAGPIAPGIVRDMQLSRRGLELIRPSVRVFAPTPDGRALLLYDDAAKSAASITYLSKKDAANYPEFQNTLARIAAVIRRSLAQTPPEVDKPSSGDLWNMAKSGKALHSLGRQDIFRLLRWGPMPVADLVGEWFETELLRATVSARGIFGAHFGPRSAGSSAVLMMRAAADPHPGGSTAFVKGGLGYLARSLTDAAQEAGAEIRTGADVERIQVEDGRATGVVLRGGEEIAARLIVSNADPRHTFLQLIDPVHLEPNFLNRMKNYRSTGSVAKVNLALAGLPAFQALAGGATRQVLSGRIHIGPELNYLERAFDDAKYGNFSRAPVLDIVIPTLTDPLLAPAGKHVMSIYVQFAPYKTQKGEWTSRRAPLVRTVVETLAAYAPELPNQIIDCQVITPLDLEQEYGLTGGHIFHGELALDQIFAMRPLLGWARYATPIKGLYLCGSGTHPGTGLTGLCGANAAREILGARKRGGTPWG